MTKTPKPRAGGREIKFRAWDKEEKRMYRVKEIVWRGMDRGFWTINSHNPDVYILMQYTGLNDKNGKEIYEGDILSEKEEIIGNIYENPELLEFKRPNLSSAYWHKGT